MTTANYSLRALIAWCKERKELYEAAYATLHAADSPLDEIDRREAIRFEECRRHLEFLEAMQAVPRTLVCNWCGGDGRAKHFDEPSGTACAVCRGSGNVTPCAACGGNHAYEDCGRFELSDGTDARYQ